MLSSRARRRFTNQDTAVQAEVLFWIHSLLQERVAGSELDCGFSLWKACKQNGFRPLNAASCWPHGRLLDAVHHAEILELDAVSYRAEQARKRNSTKRSEAGASAPGLGQ